MALNFKIFSHKKKEQLFLRLVGDFDGSSAHELINALKKHGPHSSHILIDTNELKAIYPFGRHVLEKHFKPFQMQLKSLVFVGENKHRIDANFGQR